MEHEDAIIFTVYKYQQNQLPQSSYPRLGTSIHKYRTVQTEYIMCETLVHVASNEPSKHASANRDDHLVIYTPKDTNAHYQTSVLI